MEQKVSVWKASLMYGAILGVVGVIYSLLGFYTDLDINGNIYSVFQIALLIFLLKLYRDNYCFGNITYKQSVIAGVIIYLYYTVFIVIFKYLLFEVIDTGLIDKEVALYEQSLIEEGRPQETIDSFLVFHREHLEPSIRNSILSTLATMILGTIVSLVVSFFIKKEYVPNNQQI